MIRRVLTLVTTLALLVLASVPTSTRAQPRSDLEIYWYANLDVAYAALVAGDIDLLNAPLTFKHYVDARGRPELIVTPFVAHYDVINWAYMSADYDKATLHHEYFGLQPETKPWVGIRNPLSCPYLRKALAVLCDVDHYLNEVYGGFGVELIVPIAYPA